MADVFQIEAADDADDADEHEEALEVKSSDSCLVSFAPHTSAR